MKKLLLALSLFPACAFAVVDATVVASGNWKSPSTWEGGSIPAVSSDNMYNITIAENDLSFTMNSAQPFDSSTVVTSAIFFDEGVSKLTIYGSNTSSGARNDINLSNLTSGAEVVIDAVSGTQAGKFDLTGNVQAGVNIILKTNLLRGGWNSSGFSGNLIIDGGTAAAPITIARVSGGGSVTVKSGSYFCSTSRMNMQTRNGVQSLVTVESGARYEAKGGIKFYKGDIYGDLIISGASPDSPNVSDALSFYAQEKVVFRAGSTFNFTYTKADKSRPVIVGSGIVYSYAAERALALGQTLQLASGGTLVLNSKNAFATGDKNEQNFFVSAYVYSDTTNHIVGDGKTTGNLKIGVDEATGQAISVEKNTIDNLTLYADSTINLWLNGNELEIVNLLQTGNTTNKFSVVICDDIFKGDLVIQNFNGLASIDDIKAYVSKSSDLADKELFVESINNSIYIYTTVPEPSTYAMIFGAIALGFVAYRRAKVRGRA